MKLKIQIELLIDTFYVNEVNEIERIIRRLEKNPLFKTSNSRYEQSKSYSHGMDT